MAQISGRPAQRQSDLGAQGNPASQKGIFACNGEFWSLGYRSSTVQLKDLKGLRYIQRLLQHPGEEFHALDLLSEPCAASSEIERFEKHESSLPTGVFLRTGLTGDAGEMLDAKAKQEYKRRHRELAEELEDARQRGDQGRAETIEAERMFLARELTRAVGLGGRDRRAGSAAERARLNVTRTIKAALQKIAEYHTSLGELLDRSIRTGSFCSYVADSRLSLSWQFSLSATFSPVETEVTAPLFVRRETDLLAAAATRSAFVGREAELALLRRLLDQAQRGEGKTVLIGGAPGVGKTRLSGEGAVEASKRGFCSLAGGCYDRNDLIPFIPFVEILEAAFAKAPSQDAFRQSLGDEAAEMGRLMPQLRRLFPDIPPAPETPIEQSRRTLFNAIVEIIARTAKEFPALLLVEDLQWADEGSLSLLNHLARSVRSMPVMIVGTYRDVELDPAGPLAKSLDELTRLRLVERIDLRGLPENAVAGMLFALSGREPPSDVVNLFYEHTGGNPFFVEELYSHLVDQAVLMDSAGEFRRDLKLEDVDVPASLRLVIGRRLARLSDNTQKILRTAAVIGRSFTFELLKDANGADEEQLLDSVEEAERAGLISSTVQYPDARFDFSHELIRQTVVRGLSAPRRQQLHLKVADAIERIYANALEDQASDLAHHLVQAGNAADPGRTVRYLSMSAKRARVQGALRETGVLYRQALALLERMPETPARNHLELGLQLGIGAVLAATRGFADPWTAAAYQRATNLGERIGDPSQVVFALTGLATPPLLRGELDSALAIADKALAVSRRSGEPRIRIWGNHIAGVVQYHRGHFALARDLHSEALAQYREEDHIKNPLDPGVLSLEYLALSAWQLGTADTARTRIREGISLSDRLQKPFGIARCSFYAAYLHTLLRDPKAAQEFSEKGINWSTKYSIQLYLDASRIVYGWAIAQQGRCAEGVACTRAALESFIATGNRLGIGAFLGFLADALLSAGLPEEANAAVEQGFSLAPPEPMDISYLWWLRGNLYLENTGPKASAQTLQIDNARLEDAEKCYRTAFSLATNTDAKSYAIRSATSLGKLLAARGEAAEARAMVEPLLKNMTEGFDTREFIDAKRLVEGLS